MGVSISMAGWGEGSVLTRPIATSSPRLSESYMTARLGVAGKMGSPTSVNTAGTTTHLQTPGITSFPSSHYRQQTEARQLPSLTFCCLLYTHPSYLLTRGLSLPSAFTPPVFMALGRSFCHDTLPPALVSSQNLLQRDCGGQVGQWNSCIHLLFLVSHAKTPSQAW